MATLPEGDFLLLVDASSYIHRAFHAVARTVRRSDNQETGAIISFCWSILKLTRLNKTALGRRPSHVAIVLDSRKGSYLRSGIYPAYKAQRPPYDPALESQLPFLPKIADAFDIPCITVEGWEADDIIATYADLAPREGLNVVIATSDKDLMQLVSGHVFLYDAMKDRDPERYDTSKALIDIDAVVEKWGVWPWEMVDFQALVGDAVDNIPGAHGIGPKKAAALIKKFGTLDAILSEADWSDEGFKPKEHQAIVDAMDVLPISRKLVELARNVPCEFEVEDLRLRRPDLDSVRKLKAFLMSLEAPQIANRVEF